MNATRATVLGIVTAMMTACASTTQFAPRPDGSAATPGKAQVRVYRPGQLWGTANAFTVADGTNVIGKLGPKGDLLWDRDPGDMSLTATPTILSMGGFKAPEAKVESGKRYEYEAWFPFFYPFSHHGLEKTGEKPIGE